MNRFLLRSRQIRAASLSQQPSQLRIPDEPAVRQIRTDVHAAGGEVGAAENGQDSRADSNHRPWPDQKRQA
jgi:hypothetical protein